MENIPDLSKRELIKKATAALVVASAPGIAKSADPVLPYPLHKPPEFQKKNPSILKSQAIRDALARRESLMVKVAEKAVRMLTPDLAIGEGHLRELEKDLSELMRIHKGNPDAREVVIAREALTNLMLYIMEKRDRDRAELMELQKAAPYLFLGKPKQKPKQKSGGLPEHVKKIWT